MNSKQGVPIVIFGAGGFAREVRQIIRDINASYPHGDVWDFRGYVVDPQYFTGPGMVVRVEAVMPVDGQYWSDLAIYHKAQVVVAIGDPRARRRAVRTLEAMNPGQVFARIIHPNSWRGQEVRIGAGSVVLPGAAMSVDIAIGRHCHIHLNTSIGHDCAIGDFCNVSPGATLSGGTVLGDGADLGTGVNTVPKAHVGVGALVAAGAVVTRKVPRNALVAGVPAVFKREMEAW